MPKNQMNIKIGGQAGQGVETSGAGFCTAVTRAGLHVYGLPDYMSRVRGGHNFFEVRISEQPLHSLEHDVHLLLAMDAETVKRHWMEVPKGGAIIYNTGSDPENADELRSRGVHLMPVPIVDIAKELGGEIMANTAALGAAAGATQFGLDTINSVIRDNFNRKGQKVVDANLEVARRGYDYVREHYPDYEYRLEPIAGAPKRMVVTGTQAFCMGAVMGGCRWMSAYPMTPSTGIIEWMAGHQDKYGIVTKHVEDEIAAICMAIGASHMGVRAMAATSGGGFSLMVEALGLAGMTETPLVIVEAQRPGPATGMPTRTEQSDLLFLLHASQGEFLRIVTAPGSIEECFEAGWRAFNLADKYQTPVLVMIDNMLANLSRSIPRADFHFEDVVIDRGKTLTYEDLERLEEPYLRYRFTDDGISPRAIPGHPKGVFISCSDEHDETGHFDDENAENRVRMVNKRLQKGVTALQDMRPPTIYGPEDADLTLVCWGSTYGPAREAVDRLNAQGQSANMLRFTDLWPMSEEVVRPYLERTKRMVAVEGNATGQLAWLLRAETGVRIDASVRRFDGRPLTAQYILDNLG